jgi:uncharacterized membrane protein YeaQ/YmgE (transglycosylase-associated protein family)
MTPGGFIVLLIIAAIVGSIGQALAGYSLGGCIVSIVVGLVGAFIGYWLARELGLPEPLTINIQGQPFPVLWSIIGSTVFASAVGLLTRRRVVRYR